MTLRSGRLTFTPGVTSRITLGTFSLTDHLHCRFGPPGSPSVPHCCVPLFDWVYVSSIQYESWICLVFSSTCNCNSVFRQTREVFNMQFQMPSITAVWQSKHLSPHRIPVMTPDLRPGVASRPREMSFVSEQFGGEGAVLRHQLCGHQEHHGNHQSVLIFNLIVECGKPSG